MRKTVLYSALSLTCAVLLLTSPLVWGQAQSFPAVPGYAGVRADLDFGRMPLYFIANQGQLDGQVGFYVPGNDKTLYFTPEGMTIALNSSSGRWAVRLDYVGANAGVRPVGLEKTGAVVSYFRGRPEEWHAGLPTYAKIIYPDLWPGIDLVYQGAANRLKYEFIVHPGADASLIRLSYRGATGLSVAEDGRLKVSTPSGEFADDIPVAFQEIDGKRMDVPISYGLDNSAWDNEGGAADGEACRDRALEYGFEVGAYDHTRQLVLDPAVLVYCGYIGGSGNDHGFAIAVDSGGNAYLTGYAISTEVDFPVDVGPDLSYNGGTYDAFVAKVNPAGTALVYCGYIGGPDSEYGYGIAVDGSGNAYVTGQTRSQEPGFPVTVGPGLAYGGGPWDAFVAKVNAAGTALVYCGYIGGSDEDSGRGIAVDTAGNAYVAGFVWSDESSFPVAGGPDLVYNGGTADAFAAKVNVAGTALVYCGYIGGSGSEGAWGIAVDGSGCAYVIGRTDSTEASFPVAIGPDLTYNGSGDAFLAKISGAGSAFVYCGYIGGSANETGYSVALNASGNAFVVGRNRLRRNHVSRYRGTGPDL